MPVRDVDAGMVWQGYNPSVFTHKTPKQQPSFYFGGSQVGSNVPTPNKPVVRTKQSLVTKVIKKYPNIMK